MKKINLTMLLPILLCLLFALSAQANDDAIVCAACHGVNGVSGDPSVPNLAGQKSVYLANQLESFKNKARKDPLMNAVAASLSTKQIKSLADFFSKQNNSTPETKSAVTEFLYQNPMIFPKGFPVGFSQYATVNRADNKQVRYLYLDDASIKEFKETGNLPADATLVMEVFKSQLDNSGQPIQGADGFYKKDTLAAYATMINENGWGEKIPQTIRNGNWKYGFFKPNTEHHPTRNMAKCMACHQPLAKQNYIFSYEKLERYIADINSD